MNLNMNLNMNVLKKIALSALLATSLSAQAASVWKITNGENTVYFGGTIHVLKAEHLPLPAEFDKAYAASQKLVFETDIEGAASIEFQQKIMSKVMLADGTTLQTRLNEETYALLKKHLASRGIPIVNFHPLKPSMVALSITYLEYKKLGFTQKGVDEIFATKAKADGKDIEWLESLDAQLDFITNMGGDDENSMIKYTIEEIKSLPTLVDNMVSNWRTGNLVALNKTMIEDMAAQYPDIYAALIIERNNNWMPKIIELLNDKPTEFVLVGAAHFAGKDSVFAKLKAKGFKIEKVN